ncbi:membrane protein [Kaistia sp. 32K]|uniref:Tim44 domain-containing protein n=1 Tax=Kaistia sp. 32K TaxID=2795690 RepID=UPI0019150F2C|nr:Tim44 domain-containing protein [Kaistia sp. 32K]BCP52953.1 membrane protein [Kaistia sp. 32K]
MVFGKRTPAILAMIGIATAMSFAAFDDAEARRGGSFGSRGGRTFQSAPTTPTAPTATQPIQRSMTQPGQATNAAARPAQQAARPGFFGGLGGSILGGLMLGGLIGMLMGNGLGGMAGAFGFILQIALLAIAGMFLFRFFANRNRSQTAGAAPAGMPRGMMPDAPAEAQSNAAPRSGLGNLGGLGAGLGGFGGAQKARPANAMNANDEIGVTGQDLDTFQKLLDEVQGAFGREDYAGLRERTTPEVMSYLSEELSQNATKGQRNDVTDITLLQGDLAEAWNEGDTDYATVAMRYESRDVMRDRATGALISGDAGALTETTELWTFARKDGGPWKVSAIQET